MNLLLDISQTEFTVARGWEPKVDQNGAQRLNRDNVPLFVADLMARSRRDGAVEIVKVTAAGLQPELTINATVIPVDLEAIPWSQNNRSGIAYRVSAVKPTVSAASKSAA
jgi:hypothetical protein